MKLLILLVGFIATTYACTDVYPVKCQNFRDYCTRAHMKQVCRKTCGVCTPPKHTTQPKYTTQEPGASQAPEKFPTYPPGYCGQRQVASWKVIAGRDAKPGDWPWQVLLQKNGRGHCGGTIINKRYVVTAAHCVAKLSDPQYWSVVAGETERFKPEGTESTYQAERVIVHPQWSDPDHNWSIKNDIALIKLNKDLQFGKFVQPACLPNADIAVGAQNCFITGWGKIMHPGGMYHKLQQAEMSPVRSDVCYAKSVANNMRRWRITADMVCAGSGGTNRISGCHGDSGGPYICKINNRWVLHGVVSWGSSICHSSKSYSVFSRVYFFKQWIIDQMRIFGY